MNYELAKELKDAGFPQNGKGSPLEKPIKKKPVATDEKRFIEWANQNMYIPTLSELIAACGERFGSVTRSPRNTWYATKVCGKKENQQYESVVGEEVATPSEAVARLWLALKEGEISSAK